MVTALDTDDSIVKSVTKEILDEINGSEKVFTTEEIREKVNKRLDEIFSSKKKNADEARRKKDNEIERKIEEDFKIIEDEDDLSSLLNMKEKDETNVCEAGEENVSSIDNLQYVANENQKCPEEKKKFFQEISDIYKEELQNSISCFKNVIDSLKIMKDSSFIEIFLILLILAVPAFLGGIITLIIIAIILLLWQLHILLSVLMKWLNSAENSIKGTIARIKRKIADMKISGGWFNRLIFSNALYSIVIFNGMFYMLIKGMMLPLKSMAAIDKMLANFISKSASVITTTLKGPSELALNNFKADALVAGKVAGKAQTKNQSSKLKMPAKAPAKNKQQDKGRDMNRQVEQVKQAIATADKQTQKHLVDGLQKSQNSQGMAQNQFKNLAATHGVDVGANTPNSARLSDVAHQISRKDGLGIDIMDSIKNNLVSAMAFEGLQMNKNATATVNELRTHQSRIDPRIEEDLIQERAEKNREIQNSTLMLKESGVNVEKAMTLYDSGMSLKESLMAAHPNWNSLNQEQQADIAEGFANIRVNRDDLKDVEKFKEWAHQNPDAPIESYYEMKKGDAEKDLTEERQEFVERYKVDSSQLIDEQMKQFGYSKGHILSNEEFDHVADTISQKFPEELRLDVIKDLKEINVALNERSVCKKELESIQQQTISDDLNPSKSKFVERLADRDMVSSANQSLNRS